MTEAEQAFAAAEAAIARVAAAGGTELDLDGEAFSALSVLPDSLSELKGLEILDLDNTQVSDLAPIAGLTNLQALRLANAQVSDLAQIAGLENLKILSLSNTQVSDLAQIAGLTNLQRLHFAKTQVSDLAPIAGLTNLRTLDLDNTQVSELAQIAGLTNLKRLYLNNTQVSDLTQIAGLPELFQVFFTGTSVPDLRPLLQCPALATHGFRDIRFNATGATRRDPVLARLAGIEKYVVRTDQTLAYLRGLPEWTASLDRASNADGAAADSEPAPSPAQEAQTQISFLLSHAAVSQAQARQLADQIRFALRDVPAEPGSNRLPDVLQAMADVASVLDRVGQSDFSSANDQAEEDLRAHIDVLEARISDLTVQLADETQAREAAEALAKANGIWANAKKGGGMALGTAAVAVVTVGLPTAAVYFLGADHGAVKAFLTVLGRLPG